MATATLTSKNQLTLPKEVRKDLDLKPGDKLSFRKIGGQYVLEARKKRSALEFVGMLYDPERKPLTQEEIKSAASDAAIARFDRSLDRD